MDEPKPTLETITALVAQYEMEQTLADEVLANASDTELLKLIGYGKYLYEQGMAEWAIRNDFEITGH